MPTIANGSASIYYEVHGSGPALVLAHGAGGSALSWWQQIPAFSARHRVIAFDHRCFGRSTCPPDDFHPRHFPSDLLAVLDAEGVERAALVCQSMGGWTGLPTALRHPDRVRALVLCGTPGGLFTEKVVASLAGIGERIGREGIVANAALAPGFSSRSPEMAFLYERISALNVNVDPAFLPRLYDPASRVEPSEATGLRVPTLVISGSQDLLFPPDVLRDVAGHLPGAEYALLEGVGHSTYFESPAEFNAVVGAFLAKHA